MPLHFFDLDVLFDWTSYVEDGYTKVFTPNIMQDRNARYDNSKINIVRLGNPKASLPEKYDMVNFTGFVVDVDLFALLRDKNRPIEFCVADIHRAILAGRVEQLRFFSKAVRFYRVPYIFTSGSTNKYEVKSPKEISFIGEILGFSQKQVLLSMSVTAENLLRRKGLYEEVER